MPDSRMLHEIERSKKIQADSAKLRKRSVALKLALAGDLKIDLMRQPLLLHMVEHLIAAHKAAKIDADGYTLGLIEDAMVHVGRRLASETGNHGRGSTLKNDIGRRRAVSETKAAKLNKSCLRNSFGSKGSAAKAGEKSMKKWKEVVKSDGYKDEVPLFVGGSDGVFLFLWGRICRTRPR